MLDKIEKVVARYDDVERQMSDPEVLADHVRLTELAQERSDLSPLVEAYQQYKKLSQELTEAQVQLDAVESSKFTLSNIEGQLRQLHNSRTRVLAELETLKQQGLIEKTLIAFISDNGGPVDSNTSINAPVVPLYRRTELPVELT